MQSAYGGPVPIGVTGQLELHGVPLTPVSHTATAAVAIAPNRTVTGLIKRGAWAILLRGRAGVDREKALKYRYLSNIYR